MEALDRAAIIDLLVAAGNRRDTATVYADAFVQYRQASENVSQNGSIVMHPRTSNPIENPFLKVRDSALRVLLNLRTVKGVEALW